MKDLRLVLDDTDFGALLETARSLIPTLAPQWTDHNVHDPGIMLVELLAWVADAQVYALGRMRRDERAAYAALMGVRPQGPVPARGLVWPLSGAAHAGGLIRRGRVVGCDRADAPVFRTTRSIALWGPLQGLRSRRPDGTVKDFTQANEHEGTGFMPFDDPPPEGSQLEMVLPVLPQLPARGWLSIGFQLDTPEVADAGEVGCAVPAAGPPSLRLWLAEPVAGDAAPHLRRELAVRFDGTGGLLRSGVVLAAPGHGMPPPGAVLVLRSRGPLLRAPRLRRVALDVLPVEQVEAVREEQPDFGNGQPDQAWRLQRPGVLGSGGRALSVRSVGPAGVQAWRAVPELARCAPGERAFIFNADTGILTFGNGVNGATFPAKAALQVDYAVSDGSRGNVPAGAQWFIAGLAGAFGANVEALCGGEDGPDLSGLRRLARRRWKAAHPLVTPQDLEAATLALDGLKVERAFELPPAALPGPRLPGLRVLMAMGTHEASGVDEPSAWLAAVAARLASRLPLGQRLQVIGPRYVSVGVAAELVAAPGRDPAQVAEAALALLRRRLAPQGPQAWPVGRTVPVLTVTGWLRGLPGVAHVRSLALTADGRPAPRAVALGPAGLPRLDIAPDGLRVSRPSLGSGT